MSFEYVEIRNSSFNIIGIIDTCISSIWHRVYYGVGDFELYVKKSSTHIDLLKRGYYVTRPDDSEVGIIEVVNSYTNEQDGDVIVASGRFAKSILDRRHIFKLSGKVNAATVLSGRVEVAVRQTVSDNAISCSFDSNRNISILELGTLKGYTDIIVDESGNATQKQVSYKNLLEYTDSLLEEYLMSARMILNESTNKLSYEIFKGSDRSTDNTDGNEPVVFSREYDNIVSSSYTEDDTSHKNTALIGGEGDGLDRFYALLTSNKTGLQRRETFVDASSINKKYKDENEQEQEYTDEEYTKLLKAEGKQELSELPVVETFEGVINTTYGQWILNDDYYLGDIVTIQDNSIGKYANVRIKEITEVMDENGYTIEAVYG